MPSALANEDPRKVAINALAQGTGADKLQVAKQLIDLDFEVATVVIETLIAGQLYRRQADDFVVVVRREGSGYELSDALTGALLGQASRRDVRRIAVSGALRKSLRDLMAEAQLRSTDPVRRLAAVEEVMAELSQDKVEIVRRLISSESADNVRDAMETVLVLNALNIALSDPLNSSLDKDSNSISAIDAATWLAGRTDAAVRTRLASLAENATAAPELKQAASRSLAKIELRLAYYERIQMVFFGLSLGSVLVLSAIGLAITFGVMGVINMAHGELMMLGAYTTYVVQQLMPGSIGLALVLSIPAAFVVAGATGIAIERGIIRHLYDRPLETLLATFGVSLVLQQTVRSIFGPLNQSVVTPDWMSGSFELVQGLAFTFNRLYILMFCLVLFAVLLGLLKYSRFGLELRAVAQNREVARTMGVASERVDALTFGLGSGVAGIAGVALSQLTNVGPNLGQAYIVDSFLVVVVGGVGSLWGTLISGLAVGVANKILEPLAGAVLAKIIVLVAIIFIIQKRPRGLFPQKGRGASS
jgi:urea transport system permease protein